MCNCGVVSLILFSIGVRCSSEVVERLVSKFLVLKKGCVLLVL